MRVLESKVLINQNRFGTKIRLFFMASNWHRDFSRVSVFRFGEVYLRTELSTGDGLCRDCVIVAADSL